MFALYLLSESTNEPDLTWLLWLVLAILAVIVIIGWMVSKKGEESIIAPEEKAAPAISFAQDDLKKIEGIGPKVEKVLNEAGVNNFAELAKSDVENLREVLVAAKLQMMDPSGWIEQAELAAKGDWGTLEKLQDELKGGRRA